jgi:phosphatidylinositol glycan class B
MPVLHLFTADSLAEFISSGCIGRRPTWRRMRLSRKLVITGLLFMNVIVAYYTATVHQSGVIAVVDYIRRERQNRSAAATEQLGPMSVGFLMPCHSTPWRSHLVHADIQAWALTCEPPIHVEPADRSQYMDEADQFYHDPVSFLQQHMSHDLGDSERRPGDNAISTRKTWPEYLVFFEQLTRDIDVASKHKSGKKYRECWREFNTHWHDDWRRRGDVIVWCMR